MFPSQSVSLPVLVWLAVFLAHSDHQTTSESVRKFNYPHRLQAARPLKTATDDRWERVNIYQLMEQQRLLPTSAVAVTRVKRKSTLKYRSHKAAQKYRNKTNISDPWNPIIDQKLNKIILPTRSVVIRRYTILGPPWFQGPFNWKNGSWNVSKAILQFLHQWFKCKD